jgi:serine protease Do
VRARGVVIAEDGRIVTALAPLGTDRTVTVRYANGRTGSASVVATDPLWGIALLQPRAGTWAEGLPLSAGGRGNTPVRWTAGDQPHSLGALMRRRRTYVGRGSELLRDAWEFDPPPSDNAIGSGVANAAGELVAVVVPPDASVTSGGAPAQFGVPAIVVRELVTRTGVTARPWLGLIARNLRAEADGAAMQNGGVRVTEVTPGSPADRAGIRAVPVGDILYSGPDRLIRTVEDLAALLETRHPGDQLPLRFIRAGSIFEVAIPLGTFPPIAP